MEGCCCNKDFNLLTPKGWECPKCGLVNSPAMSFCPCSKASFSVNANWTKPSGDLVSNLQTDTVFVSTETSDGTNIVLAGEKEEK